MTEKKLREPKVVQSVVRAADILNLFMNEKKPLGITDFSKALSLPKTTIQGLVNTLLSLHYLERDPITSRYRLGPGIFQLGMKYATNLDLVDITRGWMERLCFQFRIPVNVGMLVGNKVVVLLRIEPENKFMSFPPAGSVIPVHTTCIGKCLLAFCDDSMRENILKEYRYDILTRNSITNRKDFLQEVKNVQTNGVSYDNQENMMGLSGIGGPIFDHTRQVIAAFAITGSTELIEKNKESIKNDVIHTSRSVSMQLGYDSHQR